MIVERREYRLRPGKARQFWDAQQEWNTPERFGPILEHCIGYFEAVAGSPERIVHLYRYDTMDQWRSIYEAYYQIQSSDYFRLVRPWLLGQETSFLVAAPIAELAPKWSSQFGGSAGETPVIVETSHDFFPGGLVPYWDAVRQYDLSAEGPLRRNLLGVQVSLVGRLHRVVHCHRFADVLEAERHFDTLSASPRHRAFVDSYGSWVARTHVCQLKPTPVECMRGIFRRHVDSEGGH